MAEAEAQRIWEENDKLQKEKRRKMIEELKSEAIELGAVQKMPSKQDEYWKLYEYGLWIIDNWKQRRRKTWRVIQTIEKTIWQIQRSDWPQNDGKTQDAW